NGLQKEFNTKLDPNAPQFDWNAPDTTILAFGDPNPHLPVNITVDPDVHANLYMVGGANGIKGCDQGDGIAYLQGGNGSLNTLMAGGKVNERVSGEGLIDQPQLNRLVGGTGHNVLRAGTMAATLTAGPQDGDELYGGPGPGPYVMI